MKSRKIESSNFLKIVKLLKLSNTFESLKGFNMNRTVFGRCCRLFNLINIVYDFRIQCKKLSLKKKNMIFRRPHLRITGHWRIIYAIATLTDNRTILIYLEKMIQTF